VLPLSLEVDASVVHLGFKRQSSVRRIMLSMYAFELFYDALARLMEYVRQEQTPYQSPP
jgi:hypothetical protein